jgi:glycosyltransferase involved in cell wall biosynthesis
MRIGIAIPAHDVAPWIGDALNSLVGQSHRDWTAVVVDDGSRDGTAAVVAQVRDPRIRLEQQDNAGVSAARNRAAALLEGVDALLFLDADDWLAPDALARLAATLASVPDAVGAYGTYAFVAEDARPGAAPAMVRAGPFPSGDILEALLVRNLFANGGHVLLRRAAVERAGGFLTGLRFGEDWEYWIRLAALGDFVTVPGAAPLLFVRQRRSGAYLRLATDPAAFGPCMAAIFGGAAVRDRLGARLDAVRRRTEAENAWIVGREMLRHGRHGGLGRLARSVRRAPSLRRMGLLALALASPLLPAAWRGPFRPY